jgi:hypothetical protein
MSMEPEQSKPRAPVNPVGYALPALGVGVGTHSVFRATRTPPLAGKMKAKATQGLADADTRMASAVSSLKTANAAPGMAMRTKNRVQGKKAPKRSVLTTRRGDIASAKRGVALAERNIMTAALRYRAVEQAMPKMLQTGARIKRGAVGAGLIGLGGLGALAQRSKEKRNAQVW